MLIGDQLDYYYTQLRKRYRRLGNFLGASLFFGIKIVHAFNFCYVAMGCILNARVEKIFIFHFRYPSNRRNLLTA